VIGGVRVVTEPFNTAMLEMQRTTDRSNMWALREAGRQAKRVARRSVRVRSGELRDSLKSSRRLAKIAPRTYRVSIGPRGGHTHLYAAKIEEMDHYTKQAYDTVAPKFKGIQEAAMARTIAKYGLR